MVEHPQRDSCSKGLFATVGNRIHPKGTTYRAKHIGAYSIRHLALDRTLQGHRIGPDYSNKIFLDKEDFMERTCIHCLLSALLLFFLAACAGTSPNILNVQASSAGVSSKQVEINDAFLARTLTFGDVNVKPLGTGNEIEAQVLVKNESSRDVTFEYRFMWYDMKGFELSSATSWIPATLTGREARGFKSVSPGLNAAGFKFMIRKPHPVTEAG
jgi:uncharacterized protein YcfL